MSENGETRYQDPAETYAAHRPRRGQPVTYRGRVVGTVQAVEGRLCWVDYDGQPSAPFIWCFADGLNRLHCWPTKAADGPGWQSCTVCFVRTTQDRERVCGCCRGRGWRPPEKHGDADA